MRKLFKRLSVAFAAALTLSVAAVLGTGCGGGKTISDPQKFIDAIKEDPEVDISLSSDLDFTGYDWEPLVYHGTLNGNGHTISNITIKKNTGDNVGIFSFGQLSVKNLKIENLNVNYFGDGKNIGGLVGYWRDNGNTKYDKEYIEGVEISGTINAMGATYVGGVVGYQKDGYGYEQAHYNKELSYSNIVSRVEVSGGSNVGGIVGEAKFGGGSSYTNFKDVKNYGTVTGIKSYVGGIVGANEGVTKYESCINYGEIKAQNRVGGIAGSVEEVEVFGCSNEGKITASESAGGVIGYQSKGKIEQCTNKGEISSRDKDGGGIVGTQEKGEGILACTNTGTVTGNACVGGIVGTQTGGKEILACTNTGTVEGDTHVGGIVGASKGEVMLISGCKNEGEIKGRDGVAGIVGACLDSLGKITFEEVLMATVSNCENAGKIYGTELHTSFICGNGDWEKHENNTHTGELYRNGVLIER